MKLIQIFIFLIERGMKSLLRKKTFVCSLVLLLVFTAVLAACGKSEPSAKEMMANGLVASGEMDSYRFEGSLGLNMQLPQSAFEADPMAGSIAQLFENIRIDIDGVYHREPFQLETNLNFHLSGDMALTLTVPLVLTEETLWVRIPQTPFFPLPPELTGKYVELDLEQVAELSGE